MSARSKRNTGTRSSTLIRPIRIWQRRCPLRRVVASVRSAPSRPAAEVEAEMSDPIDVVKWCSERVSELQARLATATALLREVEWSASESDRDVETVGSMCPVCRCYEPSHDDDCRLAAFLAGK